VVPWLGQLLGNYPIYRARQHRYYRTVGVESQATTCFNSVLIHEKLIFFAILTVLSNSDKFRQMTLGVTNSVPSLTTGHNGVRNVYSVLLWKHYMPLRNSVRRNSKKLSFSKNNNQTTIPWQWWCNWMHKNFKLNKFLLTMPLPYNRTHLNSTADQTWWDS
jgi:hypothetical protein